MGIHRNVHAVLVAATLAIAGCKGSDGANGNNGAGGADGLKALVLTTTLTVGDAHCSSGGLQIDSGLDANKNNALDAGEITATSYVCNGLDGVASSAGANSLVLTTAEPAGANCPAGGYKVVSGVDLNKDNTLTGAEIAATSYVCNGAVGGNGLVVTTAEPAGANCATGGVRLDSGTDLNRDGSLTGGEISSTRYVCAGVAGAAGSNTLVNSAAEAAGANCATGGLKLDFGLDVNANGTLDAGEVTTTKYVCNGAVGLVGPAGPLPSSSGFSVNIVSVTTAAGTPVVVRFKLTDDRGFPVDARGSVDATGAPRSGAYSVNQPVGIRFALAYLPAFTPPAPAPAYKVVTITGSPAQPTTYTAAFTGRATQVNLVENGTGAGDYTFTFKTDGTSGKAATGTQGATTCTAAAPCTCSSASPCVYTASIDAAQTASTHTVWVQAARQAKTTTDSAGTLSTDPTTFYPVNLGYDFVPAGGAPLKRELVLSANCSKCHTQFKAEITTGNGFHGAGRIEARFCNVCHNPDRVSNPDANSNRFVHRLHQSEEMQPTKQTSGTSSSGTQGATTCTAAAPCTCTVSSPCVTTSGNLFHAIKFAYPQDIRNCDMCHGGAAQGAQIWTNLSRNACGSCHDYVDFAADPATTTLPGCTNPVTVDVNGLPVLCYHVNNTSPPAAPLDDTTCVGCHASVTTLKARHQPVAPPDPTNTLVGGANANTNAAWMAAAGLLPNGAVQFKYDVATVDTVAVAALGGLQPTIKFRWLQVSSTATTGVQGATACTAGAPCTCTAAAPCAVPMATYAAATDTEIFGGLAPTTVGGAVTAKWVGSPSVYFVYSVPQDGVAAPAEFNGSASGYLKGIWIPAGSTGSNNTKTSGVATSGFQASAFCSAGAPCTCTAGSPCIPTSAGTISGPDATMYYTVQLTGIVIPANATHLSGGLGFTYSLSGTQPLTQVNLGSYPFTNTNKSGGLIVPVPDAWVVANGHTGRRAIVDNAKCNACHAPLGVTPSFHAGQRNDGPSCAWCHNPNRTSSGWEASAKGMTHAIHAGRIRYYPYSWHAKSATDTFADVEFPSPLNSCLACHVPGGFDFNAPATTKSTTTSAIGYQLVGGVKVTCTTAVPCDCTLSGSPCVLTDKGADALSDDVNNLLPDTVATGRYNNNPATNSTYYTLSPFVAKDNIVNYGFGYSTAEVTRTLPDGIGFTDPNGGGAGIPGLVPTTQGATPCTDAAPCVCTATSGCTTTPVTVGVMSTTAATPVICTAAAPCTCTTVKSATTGTCAVPVRFCSPLAPCAADEVSLVNSPITSACGACHDSPIFLDHMQAMGGKWYWTRRAGVPASAHPGDPTIHQEQCMICHGPRTAFSVNDVHK